MTSGHEGHSPGSVHLREGMNAVTSLMNVTSYVRHMSHIHCKLIEIGQVGGDCTSCNFSLNMYQG